jgi:hypothetical protein
LVNARTPQRRHQSRAAVVSTTISSSPIYLASLEHTEPVKSQHHDIGCTTLNVHLKPSTRSLDNREFGRLQAFTKQHHRPAHQPTPHIETKTPLCSGVLTDA